MARRVRQGSGTIFAPEGSHRGTEAQQSQRATSNFSRLEKRTPDTDPERLSAPAANTRVGASREPPRILSARTSCVRGRA